MKKPCHKCMYWTRDPLHDRYKCRVGTCPDVERENKRKIYEYIAANRIK